MSRVAVRTVKGKSGTDHAAQKFAGGESRSRIANVAMSMGCECSANAGHSTLVAAATFAPDDKLGKFAKFQVRKTNEPRFARRQAGRWAARRLVPPPAATRR